MDVLEELEILDPRISSHVATRIEVPTPHKVAVLILIQTYLKAQKAAADTDTVFPTTARRNFCVLLLKLVQFPDMSYNDLYNLLTSPRYKIDSMHMEEFEKAMADLFNLGVGGLFDFAERQNIEKMLSEQLGVSQFSIVGLHIRRVGVVLERMSFLAMISLHKSICLYYENGMRALSIAPRKILQSTGSFQRMLSPSVCSSSSSASDSSSGSCTSVSGGCVEMSIDTSTTPTRAPLVPQVVFRPKEERTMDVGINDPLQDVKVIYQDRNHHSKWAPKQADLLVAQQTQLLETNELQALSPIELQDKLREIIRDNQMNSQAYFLWAMNQLRVRDYFGCMDAFHRAFDRCPPMVMLQKENKGFQYFSVNLAIFQSCFNHHEEAMLALKESIMLSQEDGDKRCLDLANTWFCLINGHKVETIEKRLTEGQYPSLMQSLSQATLYVVKYGGYCGCTPMDLFDLLSKNDEMNRKSSLIEYVADSLAIRAGLWCIYGRHDLSTLYSQILIRLKKKWAFGDYGNLESVGSALSHLALYLNEQGEYQMSSVVLDHAQQRIRRYPNRHCVSVVENHVGIFQAMYRCDWREAMSNCCELFLLDEYDGNSKRANVYVARGHCDKALKVIRKQVITPEVDVVHQVRTLVLSAYATLGRRRASAHTVLQLISAFCLAGAAFMDYEQAYIQMVMAQTLLAVGMREKAFQAINNSMDMITSNGGVYDRCVANLVYARCYMALLHFDEGDDYGDDVFAYVNERKKSDGAYQTSLRQLEQQRIALTNIARVLERTAEYLKAIDGHAKILDIYAYLSRSFHRIGDRQQRNRYACMFRLYYTEYPVTNDALGLAF